MARKGPVFIVEHGDGAYVLLRMEDYRRLIGSGGSVVELL